MLLQIGGHGDHIAQGSKVRIVTTDALPMQVDGEPVILLPSEITIDCKNQASMIAAGEDTSATTICATTVCSC